MLVENTFPIRILLIMLRHFDTSFGIQTMYIYTAVMILNIIMIGRKRQKNIEIMNNENSCARTKLFLHFS